MNHKPRRQHGKRGIGGGMIKLSEIEEYCGKATDEQFEFTTFSKISGRPIETVDDIIETMSASARKSESVELWGVTTANDQQGKYKVVCYTGNGPKSRENAAFISSARTDLPEAVRLLREARELILDDLKPTDIASAKQWKIRAEKWLIEVPE